MALWESAGRGRDWVPFIKVQKTSCRGLNAAGRTFNISVDGSLLIQTCENRKLKVESEKPPQEIKFFFTITQRFVVGSLLS